jgi:hypothetical protein
MKLIALKNISSRLPKGTVFDEGNRSRARMLIHAKVAAAHPDQPATPPAAPSEPPPPAALPTEPSPVPEPDKKPSQRSTRVGAHSYSRNG